MEIFHKITRQLTGQRGRQELIPALEPPPESPSVNFVFKIQPPGKEPFEIAVPATKVDPKMGYCSAPIPFTINDLLEPIRKATTRHLEGHGAKVKFENPSVFSADGRIYIADDSSWPLPEGYEIVPGHPLSKGMGLGFAPAEKLLDPAGIKVSLEITRPPKKVDLEVKEPPNPAFAEDRKPRQLLSPKRGGEM